MTGNLLLYIGAAIVFVWGIAHIMPTGSVVKGFGPISLDNRRIVTMEWTAEGLTLSFLGLLVVVITATAGAQNPVSITVARMSAAMLLALAGLSSFTGARTTVLPMRLCPVVKTVVAMLFLVGSLL